MIIAINDGIIFLIPGGGGSGLISEDLMRWIRTDVNWWDLPSSSGSVSAASGRGRWEGKDWDPHQCRRWCNNYRWCAPAARDSASAPWPHPRTWTSAGIRPSDSGSALPGEPRIRAGRIGPIPPWPCTGGRRPPRSSPAMGSAGRKRRWRRCGPLPAGSAPTLEYGCRGTPAMDPLRRKPRGWIGKRAAASRWPPEGDPHPWTDADPAIRRWTEGWIRPIPIRIRPMENPSGCPMMSLWCSFLTHLPSNQITHQIKSNWMGFNPFHFISIRWIKKSMDMECGRGGEYSVAMVTPVVSSLSGFMG